MLTHVLHTGYRVDNLQKAIDFYTKLGFEIVNQFEKPEPKAHVATVKKNDTAFELWEFVDVDHSQVKYIQNHVAIYSDNLESDVNELTQNGYKIVIPITEGVILKYAFVQDNSDATYEIATNKAS